MTDYEGTYSNVASAQVATPESLLEVVRLIKTIKHPPRILPGEHIVVPSWLFDQIVGEEKK